jgi:protein O-mannosyl-transferase
MIKKYSNYLISGALFLGVLLVFLPVISNGFINWDDGAYIYNNKLIQGFSLQNVRTIFFSAHQGQWIPLTYLVFMFNYLIAGLNPKIFHFSSLLFHSLNTVLVFFLFKNLITNFVSKRVVLGCVFAAFFAFLWGVHPLRVESVAWACELKDVLSGFFVLVTFLLLLEFYKSRKELWRFWALIAYVFALMAKPVAIFVPGLLIFLVSVNYWVNQDLEELKFLLKKTISFFVLAVSVSVFTLMIHKSSGALTGVSCNLFKGRTLFILHNYFFYIKKTLMSVNLELFYPMVKGYQGFLYLFEAGIFLFGFLGAVVLFAHKRFMIIFIALGCYIIAVFVNIGFFQSGPQAVADRFSYLSTLSLFYLVAVFCVLIYLKIEKSRFRQIAIIIFVLVFMVLGSFNICKTRKQISFWKDSVSFWEKVVGGGRPMPYFVYSNLGVAYEMKSIKSREPKILIEKAVVQYKKALELNPNSREVAANLKNAYRRLSL